MRVYENFYLYATYLFYILYVITYFGLWKEAPQYLNIMEYVSSNIHRYNINCI